MALLVRDVPLSMIHKEEVFEMKTDLDGLGVFND